MTSVRNLAPDPDDVVVATHELTKTFGQGDKAIHAVRGISLTVQRGEIFGVIGPNGAGKTTFLHMLVTLSRPTSGSATICGFDVQKMPDRVRASIGVALQENGLDPMQTGRELLTRHARLWGFDRSAARRRAAELLERVDLIAAADRRVATYSGGMQRRLDLALAIVGEPRLVLLDEPTTGLDPISRRAVWSEVVRLRERGVTFLLTTQYLEEADTLADQVAIIDNGVIVTQGEPAHLKKKLGGDVVTMTFESDQQAGQASSYLANGAVVTGHDVRMIVPEGAQAVPRLVDVLSHRGIVVQRLTVSTPTLDEVFFASTGHAIQPAEPSTGSTP
ncbi:ATP-binding cassette domain-containing protein [Nocardia sp. NPDC051570]|uniref:ATP-binding cassette domain-containing protein n=1 Tax=Nocardia sp. NPDC051570 TaxID=3364324 RepID=UPI0037BBD179